MSIQVGGDGVSRKEFRGFKAEVNQKLDAILELLQAHVTGTAKRLDALEGRLERVEDHLGTKEPVR